MLKMILVIMKKNKNCIVSIIKNSMFCPTIISTITYFLLIKLWLINKFWFSMERGTINFWFRAMVLYNNLTNTITWRYLSILLLRIFTSIQSRGNLARSINLRGKDFAFSFSSISRKNIIRSSIIKMRIRLKLYGVNLVIKFLKYFCSIKLFQGCRIINLKFISFLII